MMYYNRIGFNLYQIFDEISPGTLDSIDIMIKDAPIEDWNSLTFKEMKSAFFFPIYLNLISVIIFLLEITKLINKLSIRF